MAFESTEAGFWFATNNDNIWRFEIWVTKFQRREIKSQKQPCGNFLHEDFVDYDIDNRSRVGGHL